MGNSLGGKKTTKVMKLSGETMKLKTPVKAEEVVKDYPPGHVLLESEAVKHYGIRAKPLQPHQNLEPKRLYFLVDLPPSANVAWRVRSGVNMSAKDRLEGLKLSRRSVSDLSIMKPIASLPEEGLAVTPEEENTAEGINNNGAMRRVTLKLPKAQVNKLMKESKNEGEVAKKIVDHCMANTSEVADHEKSENGELLQQQMHWKGSNGRIRDGFKARQRRVSFQTIKSEGGSQIAVAS